MVHESNQQAGYEIDMMFEISILNAMAADLAITVLWKILMTHVPIIIS